MTSTTKLYEVRDGSAFIGTYFAKNEKHAIQRAVDEANSGANAFRKSWTRITLKAPQAIEIKS